MQRRRLHLRIGSGRRRLWRARAGALVRIVTLLAFAVASIGVPVRGPLDADELAEADQADADPADVADVPRAAGSPVVVCRIDASRGCGCSVPLRRGGKCCCVRPPAASQAKSCCATAPQPQPAPAPADERPCEKQPAEPGEPVLECPCGQTDFAGMISPGDPRLLTAPPAARGRAAANWPVLQPAARRPSNSVCPETPPPERCVC